MLKMRFIRCVRFGWLWDNYRCWIVGRFSCWISALLCETDAEFFIDAQKAMTEFKECFSLRRFGQLKETSCLNHNGDHGHQLQSAGGGDQLHININKQGRN